MCRESKRFLLSMLSPAWRAKLCGEIGNDAGKILNMEEGDESLFWKAVALGCGGTEKSALQVNMCAGTCQPQSRFSHTSIIGDCRAPKRGGWIPGGKKTFF